jgi:hypothetical protein
MSYTSYTQTQSATAPVVEARLQAQARETAGVVADINGRLDRLLNRLRAPIPVGIENKADSVSNTLDAALTGIRHAASRAHELLNEIEGLV